MNKAEDLALEKYPPRSVLVVPARGGGYYAHTTPVHICRQACDYYKDFRNYMKGETL